MQTDIEPTSMESAAPMSEAAIAYTPTGNGRLLQLDILRGFAIMLVLGFHMPLEPGRAGVLAPLATVWKRFGWAGVDLFFVLSGFLVGGLLFRELLTRGTLDVKRFLIRRGFKIWPSYYLYLLFFILVPMRRESGGIGPSLQASLPGIFHLQNYFGHIQNHTWSLAVEEHFYLILPLLLLLLIHRSRTVGERMAWVPAIAVFCMVVCTALRLWASAHAGIVDRDKLFALVTQTHVRIDGLFCGVLLAWAFHFHRSAFERWGRRRGLLISVATVLVAPMLFLNSGSSVFVRTIGFTFLYIGFACLLTAVVCTPIGEGSLGRLLGSRAGRVLGGLGIYSYTVYLWHSDTWKIADSVQRHLWPLLDHLMGGRLLPLWRAMPDTVTWSMTLFAIVLLAVVVGIFFGRLAEKPMLILRDRMYPARSKAPAINMADHSA